MWNLRKWYKWTYLQNWNRVTDVENKHDAGKAGGIKWEIEINIYKWLYTVENQCVFVCMPGHSVRVWLFLTPWTVSHQVPLFMEFSRQEYWRGLSFSTQGTFPTQGSNPLLLHLLYWQADSLSLGHQEAWITKKDLLYSAGNSTQFSVMTY